MLICDKGDEVSGIQLITVKVGANSRFIYIVCDGLNTCNMHKNKRIINTFDGTLAKLNVSLALASRRQAGGRIVLTLHFPVGKVRR